MSAEVKVAAGSLKLRLLTTLLFVARWPDWQNTSLFTRVCRLAGMVEPSNVYPRIAACPGGILENLLDPNDADEWNTRLQHNLRPCELDGSMFVTAMGESQRVLLSTPMSKQQNGKPFLQG